MDANRSATLQPLGAECTKEPCRVTRMMCSCCFQLDAEVGKAVVLCTKHALKHVGSKAHVCRKSCRVGMQVKCGNVYQ